MKKMWLSLGILSICMAVSGQKTTTPKKPATTKPKPASQAKTVSSKAENTLLWEITGKGLKQPSYLFGTMHLMCAEDAGLSDNLRKAIKETEQIYFEIDMDDFTQMMSAMKYLRMNDNIKLSDLLKPEEYDRIKNYFKENPSMIPFGMMERFKPYMLTSLLSETGMGCEKVNGLEMTIMEEAKKNEKEIRGLETTEYQAGLFDSIPYQKQAKELLNYIDSIDKYKKSTAELVEVYKKQDLNRMLEMTTSAEAGLENYLDLLLFNRNKRWISVLNLAFQHKPTLVAVGAGHLPGKDGVINLLRKAGYTLKPIPHIVKPVVENRTS